MGTKVKMPVIDDDPKAAATRIKDALKNKKTAFVADEPAETETPTAESPAEFDKYGRIKNRNYGGKEGGM